MDSIYFDFVMVIIKIIKNLMKVTLSLLICEIWRRTYLISIINWKCFRSALINNLSFSYIYTNSRVWRTHIIDFIIILIILIRTFWTYLTSFRTIFRHLCFKPNRDIFWRENDWLELFKKTFDLIYQFSNTRVFFELNSLDIFILKLCNFVVWGLYRYLIVT